MGKGGVQDRIAAPTRKATRGNPLGSHQATRVYDHSGDKSCLPALRTGLPKQRVPHGHTAPISDDGDALALIGDEPVRNHVDGAAGDAEGTAGEGG